MKSRMVLIFPLILACIVVDQTTKWIAQEFLMNQGMQTFFWDMFRLQYAENSGAFLGMGSLLAEDIRFYIFIVVPLLMLLALLVYLIRSSALSRFEVVSLALISGGGISNLLDRIYRNGVVVDFMNMGLGSIRTGIFNFADMYIMTGVFLMFFAYFWDSKKPAKEEL